MHLFFDGILFFLLALLVQHIAYIYVDGYVNGTHVGDLLLDNLPAINLDFFLVQGALIATLIILGALLVLPKYLPFSLKTLSFFLIIRSFFISLTHLGTNLHQITLNTNTIGFKIYDILYNSKNDFFFSGHVGASFLFALIFWKQPFMRYLFLVISCIMAVSMLLAHMHYSIDVFAAPFITFTIFIIAKNVFKADYKLTQQ
jgi:hypothetical protein